MAVAYKIVVDCQDPHRVAAFWAEALDYVVEDHSTLIRSLLDAGHVTDADVTTMDGRLAWRIAAAVRDPDAPVDESSGIGQGGRVLFQVVPEPKTVKNRVHLDLHVGVEQRAATVERLEGLGATKLYDGAGGGSTWVTMADPEGNEFCVA
jgi:Glyoxalase-like domain